MKYKILMLLFLITYSSKSQIPDSTLTALFQDYSPTDIKIVLRPNEFSNEIFKEYITALSFKIPVLNPVSNQKITSSFGFRIHPVTGEIKKHRGTDIRATRRQKIYAAADGEVIEVGYQDFLGNYIKIKHLLGFVSLYGHLKETNVTQNEMVYQGQVIGSCGDSGRTTGVHLHFSILWHGQYLNPYNFIF
jgi:murein DD-endopeptidase MepM/ murein hydrolase activator NlpD